MIVFSEKSDGFMDEKVIDACASCGHGRDQHTSIGCWAYGWICTCEGFKAKDEGEKQ